MNSDSIARHAWRFFYWRVRKLMGRLRSSLNVYRVIRSGRSINLELGSPRRPEQPGWMCSDWEGDGDFAFDLTKRIPLPDGSVRRIYLSHVLEHFAYPEPMLRLLRECNRILALGGELRIAVPDARIFLDAYRDPQRFDREKYCSWDVGLDFDSPINYVNFVAHLGGEHKHLFDEYELRRVILAAGFRAAERSAYDSSIDLSRRREESVYAVGIK